MRTLKKIDFNRDLCIGKWYSVELNDGGLWYMKYDGIDGDKVLVSECYAFQDDGSLYCGDIIKTGKLLCYKSEITPHSIKSMTYGDVMEAIRV